jgi:hypothetical protein
VADDFSEWYGDLPTGSYDCVDRIVLNVSSPLGHNPGGFRGWWRWLHGGSDDQHDTHLMRFAGRFARRVKAWAAANGVPVIYCKAGERKHLIAEEYLAAHEVGAGAFREEDDACESLFIPHHGPAVGSCDDQDVRAPAVCRAQVILNCHGYIAATTAAAGIGFAKEGNCFTGIALPHGLAQVADTLSQDAAIWRLGQVCDRWILLGVPVLRPGPGRAGPQRVPLCLFHLPGRIQPRSAVPLWRADGGPV